MSRSIGDLDVGEFIVPIPHVKQIKVIVLYLLSWKRVYANQGDQEFLVVVVKRGFFVQ